MLYRLLVCLLAAGLAAAQPRGMGREGGFFRFSPVLLALDADKDGSLSADEISNTPKALRALDKNGDGQITADETRPQIGPGGAGDSSANISAEMVQTLLEFDRNNDGKLAKDEVPQRFQGLFARCDADKDGLLTKDELTKAATASATQPSTPGAGPGREGARGGGRGSRGAPRDPVITALDADGDGTLSAAEIDDGAAALRKLDKNGDGRVTEDEVRPSFGGMRGDPPREEKQ